jgi:hypothetical protein
MRLAPTVRWYLPRPLPVYPGITGTQVTWVSFTRVIPNWVLPIWVNRGKPHQKQRQAKGDVFPR